MGDFNGLPVVRYAHSDTFTQGTEAPPWRAWNREPRPLYVYGFDLNDTLVTTPSGKYPPVGVNDWKWRPHVRDLLVGLLAEHSRNVVWILTNQGWSSLDALALTMSIARHVRDDLATAYADEYAPTARHRVWLTVAAGRNALTRKPSAVSWENIVTGCEEMYATTATLLVYCGDDADRTCADVFFAANTGTKFLHANALDATTPISTLVAAADYANAHPRVVAAKAAIESADNAPPGILSPRAGVKEIRKACDDRTVIMICGLQGSGKSSFAEHLSRALGRPPLAIYNEFSGNVGGFLDEHALPIILDQVYANTSAREKIIAAVRKKVGDINVVYVHVWANAAACARNVWERGVRFDRHVPTVALRVAAKKWDTSDLVDVIAVHGSCFDGYRATWVGPSLKDLRL